MSVEELASKIQENLAESWLPRIYRERVLKLRTRSYHFENVTLHDGSRAAHVTGSRVENRATPFTVSGSRNCQVFVSIRQGRLY